MWFRILCCVVCVLSLKGQAEEKNEYVSVRLMGQLGNQLFQIAAAYAYALDHGLTLTVPDLVRLQSFGIPHNAQTVFLERIETTEPSGTWLWREPSFNYHPIPSRQGIELFGYFQSERYFQHRRDEILALFAPPSGMREKIVEKYPFLASGAKTVGVQIRDYRSEFPQGNYHPTHRRDYYEKALALFPDDVILVVSSNNRDLAKECIEGLKPQVVYLNADYIEEFYTLTLCQSFVISNSSFGWWAAWLSTSTDKTVVAPKPWFALPYDSERMMRDLLPSQTIIIKGECQSPNSVYCY